MKKWEELTEQDEQVMKHAKHLLFEEGWRCYYEASDTVHARLEGRITLEAEDRIAAPLFARKEACKKAWHELDNCLQWIDDHRINPDDDEEDFILSRRPDMERVYEALEFAKSIAEI